MTVAELIEMLADLDPTLPVGIPGTGVRDGGVAFARGVSCVRVVEDGGRPDLRSRG